VQTSFQIRIGDAKAEAESYKSQLDDVKAHEAQLRAYIKVMTIRVLHSAPYLTVIRRHSERNFARCKIQLLCLSANAIQEWVIGRREAKTRILAPRYHPPPIFRRELHLLAQHRPPRLKATKKLIWNTSET
jgi:hypothetical protein